ncbi:exosome non-catalytic core subunit rrp46 [Elasticomyces elasticus]|nr:exosome non-catalytic core subunit rrp46 [Elasticomyces elasticus]KAK3667407.1 exosome non-catalytic core subunit rrp46 [Elasticomyces elasticus]KAK4915236.1 exosome non-catalytic core subunit rrp46 [Elasticomyces elasticus]KAK5760524.1 exosome non-catalytic core subunit rrp46 [Elasticomyces elasticus]
MGPDTAHHALKRADGSATFSSKLFTVLAGVNGPVDVQRRDELPEEAAIEVNIRPSSGVGGPRERWLESIVAAVLRSVLLVHIHPRTLIQVTLQITKTPSLPLRGAVKDIAVLPPLINAALLALADGGLPLQSTIAAGLFAVLTTDEAREEPSEKELAGCKSVHALAYNNHGDMLLSESAGKFDLEGWEQIANQAEESCRAAMASSDEDGVVMDGTDSAVPWLRRELTSKAQAAVAWREAT